jgi:FtsP/CotA-like multicopper oxidase with cupredoxin domain
VLQNLLESGNLRSLLQFRVVGPPVTQPKKFAAGDALMEQSLLNSFNNLQAIAQQVRAGRVPSGIVQRSFRFERGNGGFQINGQFFDLNRDDASPQAGALELWNLQNDSGGWFHPVHLHLLHAGFGFIVVDRNGVPIRPGDQEYGWKETVNVGRNNESVRVLMQWPPVPVNPNNPNPNPAQVAGQKDFRFFQRRYVFHCHNVDHEDHDMMAQVHILPDPLS